MGTKVGVWIDYKQAIVVHISDDGEEIKKVAFDGGKPVRRKGQPPPQTSYTPNDFVAEKRLERKLEADRRKYYDAAIACIQGAEAILILGPGKAKGEFHKRVQAQNVGGAVEVKTADSMTDRQLAAELRKHFDAASPRKTVASKKSAAPKTPAKKAAKAHRKKKKPTKTGR